MATTSLRENGGFQRGSSSLNHINSWKHIVGIFELAQQRDLDAFGKPIHANVHVPSSNMHCAHLISAMFIPISTWESKRPRHLLFCSLPETSSSKPFRGTTIRPSISSEAQTQIIVFGLDDTVQIAKSFHGKLKLLPTKPSIQRPGAPPIPTIKHQLSRFL